MADADEPGIYDKPTALRVIAAAKLVEAWARDLRGGRPGTGQPSEHLWWARVTDHAAVSGGGSGGYKYAWTEEDRTAFGFTDPTDPRTGTTSERYAIRVAEQNAGPAGPLPNGTHVLIRATGQAGDETDSSTTAYTIVDFALPPARSQFMVLQLMDGVGSIDWDWPKGH